MTGLSVPEKRLLLAILALGTVARVITAFSHQGVAYDIESYALMDLALRDDGLSAYDAQRWPYGPGFFPWILISGALSRELETAFFGLIKVPALVADALLAWLVQLTLADRGVSPKTRLGAAALISLGPIFLIASVWHGQIDSVAILPAVLALRVWTRGGPGRAARTGALLGVATAIKSVPAFLVLAFLPTARARIERIAVATTTVAVAGLLLAPFLIANFDGTTEALGANRGIAGFGGPSLIVQPGLIELWIHAMPVEPSRLNRFLTDHQQLIVAVAVAAAGALLWSRRADPVQGAVVIWLTVFAVNPNFSYTYLVWGIPFFLIAGHVRAVALLQGMLAVPAVLLYRIGVDPAPVSLNVFYTPFVVGAWLALVGGLVLAVRRLPGRPV